MPVVPANFPVGGGGGGLPFNPEALAALSGGIGFGGSSSGRSFVAPFQQPFLQNLFNLGQNQLNQALPQAQQLAAQLPQQLVNPSFDAFNQLISGGANPFLEQQIQNQQDSLGRFFNEQLLPGVNRGSVASGGFGGARNIIQRGQAAESIGRTAADAETALRFQGFQQQQQGQLGALGLSNSLVNLGLSPTTAPFLPLQAQQGIVGPPIILSRNKSRSGGSFSL